MVKMNSEAVIETHKATPVRLDNSERGENLSRGGLCDSSQSPARGADTSRAVGRRLSVNLADRLLFRQPLQMFQLPQLLRSLALACALLAPPSAATAGGFPAGQPVPPPPPLDVRAYRMVYNASARPPFRFVAYRSASGSQPLPQGQAKGVDQISLRVYDPIDNALRINATLSPGGSHTPTNADQVFTSTFDSANNAVRVNCVLGCGSSVTFGGDLGGSLASQTVVGLQGRPVAASSPTPNQVLSWNGSAWAPTTPSAGAGAGTGVCGSNQFVTGVNPGAPPSCAQPAFSSLGGTATSAQLPAANSSAQGAVQLAQDLTGSATAPKVAGLQGNPVSPSAPTANQFLGWSGTQWAPVQPAFSNLTGSATSSQLPAATPSAQGAVQLARDLTGSAPAPRVAGLQGNPVSSAAPTANQVLTWNGTWWVPTTPPVGAGTGTCGSNQFVTGVVLGSSPTCTQPAFSSLSGTATAAQLPAASSSAQGAVQLAQDLAGSAAAPKVAGLQGNPVSASVPTANEFLGWSGSQWAPVQPAFGNLTGSATSSQLPGATSSAQGAVELTQDLTGSATSPKVAGLQGNPVSATAPTSSQVLTWNGSAWTPTTPAAGAGAGTCPSGEFVAAVVLGSSPTCTQPSFSSLSGTATPAQLPAASSSAQGTVQLAQDLAGTATAPQVAGLQGNPVASTAPTSNQVLTWNGTAWAPSDPATGAQIAQDLGGSTASPQVVGLQGNPVSSTAPTSNQVLTWNGTTWMPTTPPATAGTGSCPADQFVTGVVQGSSPTCTQPTFSVLGGTLTAGQLPGASYSSQGAVQLAQDLTGTAAAPQVAGLQGNPVSSTTPTPNQVLTWNGTAWAPATPPAPGAQIAQDLGGTAATPKVVGLQGNPISSATPTGGQCLTYSGTQWAPGECAPGAGAPGGSTSQVQFNNNGSLGGAASLTYNASTGAVTAGNSMFIGGPTPWVDVTTAGAKCDGSTDDTAALQAMLAAFNAAGYGRMFIPNTGSLCIVKGYTSAVSGSIAPGTPSAGYATITVSTPPPSWITAGAPVDIWGTTGGTGGSGSMGYNGVFLVSSTTSTTIVISSSVTGTSSGGNVSAGLWTNAIVDIEGQCTTRQNSANCSGFSTPAADSPIYIFSSVPCTGTCPSGQNSNTVSIRHVNFKAGSSTSGMALGGIYTVGVNGFEVSDDNFQNFTGSAGNGLGAGAGITYDGGTGYTENGYTVNNKFYNDKYGITTRNKASGNLFIMNHAICTNGSDAIIVNSIAFDIGYVWSTAGGMGSSGGENTLFANQEEGCTIGYIVDYQNYDNIVSKSEITGNMTNTANSIGFSVLNSFDVWLDAQSKNYSTGVHVNGSSTGVRLTNPRLMGANSTETITSDGGSFTSASNYVEPGALPTTTVFGLTDTQTSNSTFLNDSTLALTLSPGSSAAPTQDGTLAYNSSLLLNEQGSNGNTFHTPKFQSVAVPAGSSSTYDCLASVTGVTGCSTQATAETGFATSYTIPANEIVSGKTLRLRVNYQTVEATAGTTVTLKLRVASTSGTTICGFPASTTLAGTRSGFVEVYLTGTQTAQASAPVTMNCNGIINGTAASNATTTPVNLATNAPIVVVPTASFAAATATNRIELTSIAAEYF